MFNMSLNLKRAENVVSGQIQEWWIVNQREPGPIKKSQKQFEEGLEVYIFSDQVSPPSLGFLAGYGYVRMFYCLFFFHSLVIEGDNQELCC